MQFITVQEYEASKRLDQFVTEKLGVSRNQVQRLISEGYLKVNEKPAKANQRVKSGDEISYFLGRAKPSALKAEKIPLDILYEDKNLIVINKQAGIVVHPDETGHSSGTLVHALLAHCKDLSGIGGIKRPGIVHRLDKDTSGVLLIAKNDKTHQKYSQLFQDRKVKKTYLALVKGNTKTQKGRIEAPITRHASDRKKMSVSHQGKNAVTTFEVLESHPGFSLLKVNIETGRTHQIRVHLASIGHPVIGDATYGDKALNKKFEEKYGLKRQFLHAQRLEIDGMVFEAELPLELATILE